VARLCAEGPLPIVRLSHGMDVTRQAVTKHLYALANAGLVRVECKGRERIWRIKVGRLARARPVARPDSVLRLRGKSHLLRHHDRLTAEGRKLPAHRRSLKHDVMSASTDGLMLTSCTSPFGLTVQLDHHGQPSLVLKRGVLLERPFRSTPA